MNNIKLVGRKVNKYILALNWQIDKNPNCRLDVLHTDVIASLYSRSQLLKFELKSTGVRSQTFFVLSNSLCLLPTVSR